MKYLGVSLYRKLNFNHHLSATIKKTKQITARLNPLLNKNNKLNPTLKVKIYKQVIRPTLAYAAPIWHDVKPNNRNLLEKLQHRILRNAIKAPYYVRNTQILRETNTPTILEYTHNLKEKLNKTLINHFYLRINTLSKIK